MAAVSGLLDALAELQLGDLLVRDVPVDRLRRYRGGHQAEHGDQRHEELLHDARLPSSRWRLHGGDHISEDGLNRRSSGGTLAHDGSSRRQSGPLIAHRRSGLGRLAASVPTTGRMDRGCSR